MRNLRNLTPTFVTGALLLAPGIVSGHGFVHEEIAALTTRLERSGADSELLIQRAELHREDGKSALARADLQAALAARPEHPAALLALARLERESREFQAAQQSINAYLIQRPDDAIALAEKALVHSGAGNWKEAAEAWQAHLGAESNPAPDSIIACANALLKLSNLQAYKRQALDVLLGGIQKHPRVIPLRQHAGAVQIQLGNLAEARQQFTALHQAYPSPSLQPRLFADEAAIWQHHGHPAESRVAFLEAQAALRALPSARRSTPGFRSLQQRIEDALAPVRETNAIPKMP